MIARVRGVRLLACMDNNTWHPGTGQGAYQKPRLQPKDRTMAHQIEGVGCQFDGLWFVRKFGTEG